jgi:hypothetical protein
MGEHRDPRQPGETARARGHTLESRKIGALPVIDRFLKRLDIHESFTRRLPREDRRSRVPTATALLLLVRNLLISREPLYGIGEWAARYDTRWLGLSDEQLPSLNDDRAGRALDRLFDADIPALALDAAARAVREFDVTLDELHNDSTSVTFHGDYEDATRERFLRGRLRLAVTWGHNKDHRPDLKQLLYILTVSADGAVPVHFRVESGNATDDRSHVATWDLLRTLTVSARPNQPSAAGAVPGQHQAETLERRRPRKGGAMGNRRSPPWVRPGNGLPATVANRRFLAVGRGTAFGDPGRTEHTAAVPSVADERPGSRTRWRARVSLSL